MKSLNEDSNRMESEMKMENYYGLRKGYELGKVVINKKDRKICTHPCPHLQQMEEHLNFGEIFASLTY